MDLYRRSVTDYLQMAPADYAVCRDATNIDVACALTEPDFVQMTCFLFIFTYQVRQATTVYDVRRLLLLLLHRCGGRDTG